jgi:CheY-like chemotaxis protein
MTTVLLIEDDPLSRKYLERRLSGWGYVVVQTDRGEEAVALARAHGPALILLDIQLPGIDGFETLRQLRAATELRPTAIVAVTASTMPVERARLTVAGFDAELSKPVRGVALEQLLRRLSITPGSEGSK